MQFRYLALAFTCSSVCWAQESVDVEASAIPTYAGTYHMASGTFEPAGRNETLGPGGSIYTNTLLSGFFFNTSAAGTVIVDEGRVPSLASGIGGVTQDSYTVTSFVFSYLTKRQDISLGGTGAEVILTFYERYTACDELFDTQPPAASYYLSGLPGSSANGTSAAYIVTVSLAGGFEFCLRGDGDELVNGDERFGWSFQILNETFGSAGPLIAGNPAGCPEGSGTYYLDPDGCDNAGVGVGTGTGLNTADLFRRENVGPGCFFFSGSPFASFYMRLNSDLSGDCADCPNDDEFEDSDDCASALALPNGAPTDSTPADHDVTGLVANMPDEDYLSVTVPMNHLLTATISFSHAQADVDMRLHNSDCSVMLDSSEGVVDTETVQWSNDTGGPAVVKIQVYAYAGAACGDYRLDTNSVVDPCLVASDDGFEDNDSCASSAPVGAGASTGLFVRDGDDDWYSVTIPAFHTGYAQALFTHANGDVDMTMYDACGGNVLDSSLGVVDNEQVSYVNATASPVTVFVEVVHFTTADCNDYDLVVSLEAGEPGTNYCGSIANSTGFPARISATGSSSVSTNNLVLFSSPVPAGQFGIFFHGPAQGSIPFFGRTLCVDGPLVRFAPVISSGLGVLSQAVDIDTQATIFQGVTRYWQAWFRDPAGGSPFSNLSDGYCITFTE